MMPKLPVTFQGRTQHRYYRYYARGPMLDDFVMAYSVHIDRSRIRAWFWAWVTWLNRKFLKREI